MKVKKERSHLKAKGFYSCFFKFTLKILLKCVIHLCKSSYWQIIRRFQLLVLKSGLAGWKDGSAVKSTCTKTIGKGPPS